MLTKMCAEYAVEKVLGNKMGRWQLPLPSGTLVRRCLFVCKLLGAEAPPRIGAQYWRMVHNGWCTGRRFQDSSAKCVFGCDSEDSIEHYCRCKVVREFLCMPHPNGPGLPIEIAGPSAFFLVHQRLTKKTVLKMAIALHAIFKARHAHKSGQPAYARPLKVSKSFFHSSDHGLYRG